MENEEIMDDIKDFAERNFTSFSPEMIKQIKEELDKIRQQILEEKTFY